MEIGHDLTQKSDALASAFGLLEGQSCYIAAWMGEVRNQADAERIGCDCENYGDGSCHFLDCSSGGPISDNDSYPLVHILRCDLREPL